VISVLFFMILHQSRGSQCRITLVKRPIFITAPACKQIHWDFNENSAPGAGAAKGSAPLRFSSSEVSTSLP